MPSAPRDNRPAPLDRSVPPAEMDALKQAAVEERGRKAHTSEAQQDYAQAVISGQCQHEANMAGAKGGAIAAGGCLAAHALLQRFSQSYRCRVELTGKVLLGSIIAYGAFYFTSFRANSECVKRHGIMVPQQGGMMLGAPTTPAKSMSTAVQARVENIEKGKAESKASSGPPPIIYA